MSEDVKRALAAVLFTDIVGYTASMQQDEALARQMLDRHREVLERSHLKHHGRLIQYFGDGSLSIFNSAVEAVACAIEIQQQVQHPIAVPLRIGIHLGDIIFEKDSVYGDAVNIASRIESFSQSGAVLISGTVYDHIRNHPQFETTLLGEFELKNVAEPVKLYALGNPGLTIPLLTELEGKGAFLHQPKGKLYHLPHELSSFVGRQQEVEEIHDMLLNNRLVTLTGPGGTGKTRLSQQVAQKIAPKFRDGVYWIPLAAIFDPTLVAFAIIKALDVKQDPALSIEATLIRHLSEQELLLILDNFEQITAAAPLIEQLLRNCPQLKALVTSRILLQLSGEQEYAVSPLPLPKNGSGDIRQLTHYPAIELFVQRAQAAVRSFKINEQNAPAIVELCRRLDGLPLAIELAAARIKLFSPPGLLKRLDQRLDLKSSNSSLPQRHRTIRSTIAWSYDLLDVEEKALFCRMSVFVGGSRVEAVEEVCSLNGLGNWDVVDGVLALVDKSLVQREEKEDTEPRFYMLETIREFAAENLEASSQAKVLKQAHARYFLKLAETIEPQLSGPEPSQWLAVLEAEQENLRVAIQNSIQLGDFETALRLGLALRPFWGNRGRIMEGIQQLEKLVELPVSEELYGLRFRLLESLGILHSYIPNLQKSKAIFLRCIAYWRKQGHLKQTGLLLNHLAWVSIRPGGFKEAESYILDALEIWKTLDDDGGKMRATNNYGWLKLAQGKVADAIPFTEETLRITKKQEDQRRYAYALSIYGDILFQLGHHQQGIDHIKESLEIHRRNKDNLGVAYANAILAYCLIRAGQPEQSLAHVAEAEKLAQKINSRFVGVMVIDQKSLIAFYKHDLESAQNLNKQARSIDKLFADFRWSRMTLITQGKIAIAQGDLATAKSCIEQLFQLDYPEDSFTGIIAALELKARVELIEGNYKSGIYCIARAEALRRKLKMVLHPIDIPVISEVKERLQKAVGVKAFAEQWKWGEEMEIPTLLG